MIETRFRLNAGRSLLDITLRHDAYPGADDLISRRFGAFVNRPPTSHTVRTIRCEWTEANAEWLPHTETSGGDAIVAERLSHNAWWAQWCFYRASFSTGESHGVFARRPPAIEHIVRGAAVFASMPQDLFFHAATLVYDGKAWLFAGHPNAGKSTLSREGAADRVISNEISILAEQDGTWTALPSPFWGTGDVAQWAAPAPLAGIVVLSQATEQNVWRRLSGVEQLAALMPHVGCQAETQLHEPELLQRVAALAGALPVYSLAWHRPSHPFDGHPTEAWKL